MKLQLILYLWRRKTESMNKGRESDFMGSAAQAVGCISELYGLKKDSKKRTDYKDKYLEV